MVRKIWLIFLVIAKNVLLFSVLTKAGLSIDKTSVVVIALFEISILIELISGQKKFQATLAELTSLLTSKMKSIFLGKTS